MVGPVDRRTTDRPANAPTDVAHNSTPQPMWPMNWATQARRPQRRPGWAWGTVQKGQRHVDADAGFSSFTVHIWPLFTQDIGCNFSSFASRLYSLLRTIIFFLQTPPLYCVQYQCIVYCTILLLVLLIAYCCTPPAQFFLRTRYF